MADLICTDFTNWNKSIIWFLPLQSLVIHKYFLIHFKSVGLPQLSLSLFSPPLCLSPYFFLSFFKHHCFCLWQFNYEVDSHFNLFKAPPTASFQLIQLYLLHKLQPHLKMINYWLSQSKSIRKDLFNLFIGSYLLHGDYGKCTYWVTNSSPPPTLKSQQCSVL